jgi:hypothetical protein
MNHMIVVMPSLTKLWIMMPEDFRFPASRRRKGESGRPDMTRLCEEHEAGRYLYRTLMYWSCWVGRRLLRPGDYFIPRTILSLVTMDPPPRGGAIVGRADYWEADLRKSAIARASDPVIFARTRM